MSKNRHINAIKSETTLQFAEFLINGILTSYDKSLCGSFSKAVKDFGRNPFIELTETTFRGYYSSLRCCLKNKWFYSVSILPYWLSVLWDKECFNRGFQKNISEEDKFIKKQITNEKACFCRGCIPPQQCLLKDYENTKIENERITEQNRTLQRDLSLANEAIKQAQTALVTAENKKAGI